MPRKLEIDALQAEAAGLMSLLDEVKEAGDIVGEMQLEGRLVEVQERIHQLARTPSPLANVALFFSGKPVFGSRGIAADFAGKTLENFQELVSRTFAAAELGGLSKRGPVPLRQNSDLMITGLAHGSFGFVLEELSDQEELHNTALKEVLVSVSRVLSGMTSESDSVFEAAIEELDSRTLITLRDFFKDLDSAEATLKLVEDTEELNLDSEGINRARRRAESTDIDEEKIVLEGLLKGFLPEHRRFEIRDSSGETIYGSATREAVEQFEMALGIGDSVVGEVCRAQIEVRYVRPLNRPERKSYRLLEFQKLGNADISF